jgi:hypothetical protein
MPHERVRLVFSRARSEERKTGLRGDPEQDEGDSGRRPVDDGEATALGPDLGK